LILYWLGKGPMRFNELRRANAGISQQMLTRELRALEQAGVVARTVYAQVPPRVDYALTEAGERLMPHIDALGQWWAETRRPPAKTCGVASSAPLGDSRERA
jgi:DNA-binding HxlR family transcriptional regulator